MREGGFEHRWVGVQHAAPQLQPTTEATTEGRKDARSRACSVSDRFGSSTRAEAGK